MSLALLALGGSALAPAIGSGVAARKSAKAREEGTKAYNDAVSFLDSRYYQDPLSMTGNKAILKRMDMDAKDNLDAINNRATAGGATMENRLAAIQSANETKSRAYATLLQGEDQRKAAIDAQRFQLDQNRSRDIQNNYLADAQNWASWGNSLGSAIADYGAAELLSKKG